MIIDSKTKLCGIIGYPLEHTMSPAIHNAAARHYKINAVFLAFPTQDFRNAILTMRTLGMLELTVTMPYKEEVMPYLDQVDAEAKALGNVNTIINKDGKLYGYNTDINGVELAFKGIKLKNKRALLLGAGGVAKTVAYVLKKRGAKLYILNREIAGAKKMSKKFQAKIGTLRDVGKKVAEFDPHLIINATPVGMGRLKGKSLIPKKALKARMTVFDLIYNPVWTKLIKDAKSKGCRTITGQTMFIGQGARQFELWSGKPAPWKIIERAFKRNIK